MFIIAPNTIKDHALAQQLLAKYEVKCESLQADVIIVTGGADLRLAEIAFQTNFRQKNQRLCAACTADIEKNGEGNATCGHLTFTSKINHAF